MGVPVFLKLEFHIIFTFQKFFLQIFQPSKNIKTILHLKTIRDRWWAKFGPKAVSLPTPDLR